MTSQEQKQTAAKSRWPLLMQLIIIIGVLLAIFFIFGQTVLEPRIQSSTAPPRLGEMRLVESIDGTEAIARVSQLHQLDIELVNAYIGSYSGSGLEATAWVGQAENAAAAAGLMSDMVEAIAGGSPAFTGLRELDMTEGYHTHRVFQVNGPGGQHFFYVSKLSPEKVVWLTVSAGDAMNILEQALKTF